MDYVTQAHQDLARMHSRGKVVIGMDAIEFGLRQGWYLTEKARSRRQRVETNDPADATNRSLPAGIE